MSEITTYDPTPFSEMFRRARVQKRLSLRQLSLLLKIPAVELGELWRGKVTRLEEAHWPGLVEHLGLTVEEIRAAYEASPAEAVGRLGWAL